MFGLARSPPCPTTNPPKVFFISPIGEAETETRKKADQTLKHLVRKALEPEPLNCKVDRADEDTDPGAITPRMINAIMTADLLVIDLTDQNPNVFYEMAIAHGYHKPCVHIITEAQKVPFDVKDMNTVPYTLTDPDKLESAVTKLRMYAKTALQNGTTNTPLSAAERFSVVQSSTDPTVEALAEIGTRLDELAMTVRETAELNQHLPVDKALLRVQDRELQSTRMELDSTYMDLADAREELAEIKARFNPVRFPKPSHDKSVGITCPVVKISNHHGDHAARLIIVASRRHQVVRAPWKR